MNDLTTATATLGATIKARLDADPRPAPAIAAAAGISKGYLSKLVNGRMTNPSTETLERLAGALDLTLDELVGGGTELRERSSDGPTAVAGEPASANASRAANGSRVANGVRQDEGRQDEGRQDEGRVSPAVAAGIDDLRMIRAGSLAPSPLNPRRHFDPAALEELAASIRGVGVLEPLLARRVTAHSFELVAGERRWRAARLVDPEYLLPVIVRDLTDAEVVEIGLVENLQREAIPPLDEAEAFRVLARQHGWSTEDIAGRIGKTRRYVQQRIAMAEKLCDEVKAALAEGTVTVTQARIIAGDPFHERQKALLEYIREKTEWNGPPTEAELRSFMVDDLPSFAWALFDRAEYDGEVILDDADPSPGSGQPAPDGDSRSGGGWFADADKATALQEAAIERVAGALREKWEWVKVHRGHMLVRDHYEAAAEDRRAGAGVLILVGPGLGIEVHENLVGRQRDLPLEGGRVAGPARYSDQPASAGRAAAPATTTPAPEFTGSHHVKAKVVKSRVLQLCLADPLERNAAAATKAAKILAIIGLTGRSDWRHRLTLIGHDNHRGEDGHVARHEPKCLREAFTALPKDQAKAVETLIAAGDEEVDRMFRAAVAMWSGDLPGYNTSATNDPAADDNPGAAVLAHWLHADTPEALEGAGFRIDAAWLEGLRKPSLIRIVVDNQLHPDDAQGLAKAKLAELRQIILAGVKAGRMKPGYVPLELRFRPEPAEGRKP